MSIEAVGIGGPRPDRRPELQEVAKGFESIFLNLLMKSMRSTVKSNPMFGGGRGEFDCSATGLDANDPGPSEDVLGYCASPRLAANLTDLRTSDDIEG